MIASSAVSHKTCDHGCFIPGGQGEDQEMKYVECVVDTVGIFSMKLQS